VSNDELLELAREFNGRGEPYALITVVRAVAPTSAYLGAQAIVRPDGTLHGWIGGGCAKEVVIAAAQGAIASGEPKLVRISNDRLQAENDVEQHTMSCASNGTIELFIQPYSPRSALCVLGSTPAADEARFLAARLGSVQHTMGEALLLPAYAAVFVGTTASRSGTPNIGGTFLGVAITGVIVNGLTIVGAEPFVQKIVTGAIIIAAVLVRRFGMARP
jgi:xanthine/CO dehydrogenase XdhC/CoxF family maturation factor